LRARLQEALQKQKEAEFKLKNVLQKMHATNEEKDVGAGDLQGQLDKQTKEVSSLRFKLRHSEDKLATQANNLTKIKQQSADFKSQLEKYRNQYHPRLKETIAQQKNLSNKLKDIVRDSELLPEMFRKEAKERKVQQDLMKQAVEDKNHYQKEHKYLVKQIDDLSNDKARKERLSLLTQAAWGNIKGQLDEEKDKVAHQDRKIEELLGTMHEMREDVAKYKAKHDEMFKSVSGLNARIEELEQHKLHLLDKLKGYGDRGDLSYIVKTQKLNELKVPDPKDRVVVEDYKPE
jgi:chromosome segregation ATPase